MKYSDGKLTSLYYNEQQIFTKNMSQIDYIFPIKNILFVLKYDQDLAKSNILKSLKVSGLVRDLNPGPLAPKARIMPLDQRA